MYAAFLRATVVGIFKPPVLTGNLWMTRNSWRSTKRRWVVKKTKALRWCASRVTHSSTTFHTSERFVCST